MTYRQALAGVSVPPLYGGFMDAKEAGRIMRAYRNKKGLTQPQVVEQTDVPSPQYLSALENGRYDVRNSDHFRALVRLYGLTPEQVRELDPLAVISFDGDAPPAAPAPAFQMPDPLREAVELYGGRFPDLLDARWQRYLAGIRFRSGSPTDPEKWLDVYRDLIRNDVVPGEN